MLSYGCEDRHLPFDLKLLCVDFQTDITGLSDYLSFRSVLGSYHNTQKANACQLEGDDSPPKMRRHY